MTRDPAILTKQLRDLGDQDFRSFVERAVKGMGLAAKGVRTTGDTMEMDAVLQPGNERYLVFATRAVDAALPHDIQKAVEKMRKSGVPRGIYITTGSVTRDAEAYAGQFDVAVADGDRFGQLLEKFGLSDDLDRLSTKAFLERDGERHLPSMGQLESMMNWGKDFFEAGNYAKALEYFAKAAELKPDYDVPHSMMGSCYSALGDHVKAVEAYEEALRRNPSSEEEWYNLGAALYALGKHDDELACYDKALELNRGYERAWNNKGATLLELGKDDEAVLCFDQALKANPKNERALSNRGVALKHLGRIEESLASFDRALEANPANLDAWLNRGLLLQEMGRNLEAVKSYDKVLEKFKTPEMQAQKASALIAAGLYRAALDALDQSLAMKPGWDVAIELRAKAEEALRAEREARAKEPVPERIMPTRPMEAVEALVRPEKAEAKVSEPKTEPTELPTPHIDMAEPIPLKQDPEPVPQEDRGPLYSSLQDFATGDTEDAVIFTCSECGSEVGESDKFCINCGSDLREEADEPKDEAEPEIPAGEPEEVERVEEADKEEREELEFEELVGLGEAHMRLGQFEDAIGRFGEAALLDGDPRLHRMQGEAAFALGHYADAAAHFEDALDGDPSDDAAALGRVESLLAAGRHAAAGEALEALLARTGKTVPLLLLKSELLDAWGRRGKALEALDEAASVAGWSADLLTLAGARMSSAGKTDGAMASLDKAVQNEPRHWEAWCARGAVLAASGELEQSLKSFDKALDTRPDAYPALAGKASVLARQGRQTEAMELLQETDVKTPELFALKSFLLLESDDLDGAVKAADDGLALDGRSPELWNLKGLALRRAGKLALAIEAFEEALTLAPDFADAKKNMASAERDAFGSKEPPRPGKKLPKPAPAQSKAPEPSPPKKARGPAPVVCQECGEENDIGAKKCSSCGAKLRYKDKEDALHREMEEAISGDLAPKKKGSKKAAQRDRESFVRELMSVPGVGYARANDIWEAGFRSEDDIHRAEMAELTRIPGVTPALARKIKKGI